MSDWIHLWHLSQSRLKPCLGPGHFPFWLKDYVLETCMRLAVHERWWQQLKPLKSLGWECPSEVMRSSIPQVVKQSGIKMQSDASGLKHEKMVIFFNCSTRDRRNKTNRRKSFEPNPRCLVISIWTPDWTSTTMTWMTNVIVLPFYLILFDKVNTLSALNWFVLSKKSETRFLCAIIHYNIQIVQKRLHLALVFTKLLYSEIMSFHWLILVLWLTASNHRPLFQHSSVRLHCFDKNTFK